MTETLRLRPAAMDDAKRLFDWRNDPDTRAVSLSSDELVWEEHLVWLERSLARTDRLLFIGEAVRTDEPIGVVRFDAAEDGMGDGAWEVGITVAPAFRGRGWSRKLLAAGLDHLGPQRFRARVLKGNGRSRSLFEGLGFRPAGEADGVLDYRLARGRAA